MDAANLFPSKYLKAQDVVAPIQLTVSGLSIEQMPDGVSKPALFFVGQSKMLVLNKTNNAMLISLFGRETDMWQGKTIECYADKVPMQGRIVDCIRVRQPSVQPVAVPSAQPNGPTQSTDSSVNWDQ